MSDNNNQEDKEEREGAGQEEVKIPPPPTLLEVNGKSVVPDRKPDSSQNQLKNRSIFPPSTVSPAAERIRFILGEEDDGPAPPQLFTELDELLSVDGQEMEWKETAR